MTAIQNPPAKKQKTLHHFFASPSIKQPDTSTSSTPFSTLDRPPNLPITDPEHVLPSSTSPPTPRPPPTSTSTPNTLPIPGLTLLPSFITSDEETLLLDFLSTQPFRTDLSRRTLHYGGTYCLLPPRSSSPSTRQKIESTILTASPIPSAFDFLLARMLTHDLYTPDTLPAFCIVNEYVRDQGISAHVENFRFAEPVVALTLGSGDYMRFHELTGDDDGSVRSGKAAKAQRTGKKVDVWLPGRSLLVMTGEARRRWQHEIRRGNRKWRGSEWRRVSLTFRTERRRGEERRGVRTS